MVDKKTHLWDKKASTFLRYNEELNAVQKGVFEALSGWCVEFAGKSLIDIGCGTGVWTLHLAQKAKSVVGVDSSQAMLKVLQEDAKRLNLSNVLPVNLNFEEFYGDFTSKKGEFGGSLPNSSGFVSEYSDNATSQSRKRVSAKHLSTEKFDIAFVSMSPALNKNEDYQAFMALAPLKIFVGWQEYRQSDFLEPIFKAFNAKQKCFDDDDMENFLRKNGIKFKKKVFEEIRHSEKPRAIAIENALWHLNMAGIEPSTDELDKLIKGESIKETIQSKIKLLVF